MEKIICVLVLYNPNIILLSKVVSSIISQIDKMWISDNSDREICLPNAIMSAEKVVYKKMSGNIGIAAAQNCGIKYAIENKYDYLYFLDQDSISPNGVIDAMLRQFEALCKEGFVVGAVGPRAFNRYENKEYRGSFKKGNRISDNITEVTELISSASFIKLSTFESAGLMDEKLFIDGVDHEWCWRVNNLMKGRFFIIENIRLSHHLGEGDRSFFLKKIAIPTPFRTYYQFRNYFILLRRNYVPVYWKLSNGVKYVVKLFYFPMCISPRMAYLKNIWKGIYDGILNNA